MSINDLLDSDIVIPAVMVVLLVIAVPLIIFCFTSAKKRNNIYVDDESRPLSEEKNAKVIARRSMPHPYNQAVVVNKIVFEFTNGNRVELEIRDSDLFGIIVEGGLRHAEISGKEICCV